VLDRNAVAAAKASKLAKLLNPVSLDNLGRPLAPQPGALPHLSAPVSREAVLEITRKLDVLAGDPDNTLMLQQRSYRRDLQKLFTEAATAIRALASQPASEPSQGVAQDVYLSAVKGRSDFREVYRRSLLVRRAAEALIAKWRTPGQKTDSDDWFAAVEELDRAIHSDREPSQAEVSAEPDLRTLVPGFRLDWSGLRNKFEGDLLRMEKLATHEMRAAHLDEMAREFEDAVLAAVSRPPHAAEPVAEPREAGWQSIETAPRDGSVFDAYWPGGGDWSVEAPGVQVTNWWQMPASGEFIMPGWNSGMKGQQPTHWRPRPTPPAFSAKLSQATP
jgi:hypothetical protein